MGLAPRLGAARACALVERALAAFAERLALVALGAAGRNWRLVRSVVVCRAGLVEVDAWPVRAVLTEVPDVLSACSSVARSRRRKPAPLLREPACVQLEPLTVPRDLDRR